jgi:hypothetical protein
MTVRQTVGQPRQEQLDRSRPALADAVRQLSTPAKAERP